MMLALLSMPNILSRIIFGVRPDHKFDGRSYVPELRRLAHGVREGSSIMIYPDPAGDIILEGLIKRPQLAAAECHMPKGSKFPEHQHKIEVEWYFISEGSLRTTVEDVVTILKAGDFLRIEPTQQHQSVALEETKVLVWTMPADEGFPDERHR